MVTVTDIIKKSPHLVVVNDSGKQINKAGSVHHRGKQSKQKDYISFVQGSDFNAQERFHRFYGNCLIIDYDLFEKIKNEHYGFSVLLSKNPRLSFMKVIKEFFYDRGKKTIHPSAQIGENVEIGAGTTIHANVVIYDGVKIGRNCKLKAGSVIGGHGFGYEQNEYDEWINFPHIGGLVIGDNVHIGSNTSIDRGTLDNTVIGNGVKIDNNVHIAHNVRIDENTLIIANSMIAGSVKIGRNCWIAPMVSIRDNLLIGDNVLIGMGAVVVKNVKSDTRVKGFPAKPF